MSKFDLQIPDALSGKANKRFRMIIKPVELGCAGHFIMADRCMWRRHTQVGNYRVSSVGELIIEGKDDYQPLGAGDGIYETAIFLTSPEVSQKGNGCGCHDVVEYCELDGERYRTAGEAQVGHNKYVAKYLKRARREAREKEIK